MFLPSAHRVELEVHCDDDRWIHLGSTESRHGLQPHLLILSVEVLQVRLGVQIFTPNGLFASLPDNFAAPAATGNMNSSPFCDLKKLLLHWFFEDKFLMRPNFPIVPDPQSEYLLSKFLPRSTHTQERFLAKLSCQIDEVLIDNVLDDIQPLHQKEIIALWVVLQIIFHKEFLRLSESFGHFEGSDSIP